jgi:hypothetical protein
VGDVGEPEIRDFDVVVRVQEQILLGARKQGALVHVFSNMLGSAGQLPRTSGLRSR